MQSLLLKQSIRHFWESSKLREEKEKQIEGCDVETHKKSPKSLHNLYCHNKEDLLTLQHHYKCL